MWIRPRNYSTACAPRAIVLCSVGSLTFNPSHFRTRRRVHGNSAPRPWIRHVRAWPPTTHPRHRCGGCRRAKVHSRVPEGGGRAWPPTTHPRHQCGGCQRAKVHSRVPEGGGRAWPGFEIDYSEPKARVWRSRGRAAALRHQDRLTRSRRHREPGRQAGGRARRHPEHQRRSHDLVDIRVGPGTSPSTGPEAVCDVSRARLA